MYPRQPAPWRGIVAIVVALVLLGLVSAWLDWREALIVWLLFSIFVVLWPNWPPLTAAEERVRAWPFEP
jgi:hypothetical protein